MKFFKCELDIHDYTSRSSTRTQFFVSVRLAGASPQRSEIQQFCDFYCGNGYTVFFSRARTQLEPVDGFSRFMAHTTCFRPRTVFLGCDNIGIHLGVISPKNSPKGA